jgi:hypothetical protein
MTEIVIPNRPCGERYHSRYEVEIEKIVRVDEPEPVFECIRCGSRTDLISFGFMICSSCLEEIR